MKQKTKPAMSESISRRRLTPPLCHSVSSLFVPNEDVNLKNTCMYSFILKIGSVISHSSWGLKLLGKVAQSGVHAGGTIFCGEFIHIIHN